VLFATCEFWQGVTCLGTTFLRDVDRLPFAVPSDRLWRRGAALQDEGRNPFADFSAAGGTA